jgi:hypothetical protein
VHRYFIPTMESRTCDTVSDVRSIDEDKSDQTQRKVFNNNNNNNNNKLQLGYHPVAVVIYKYTNMK